MMHSKTQTMNRETLDTLHNIAAQLELEPIRNNDPGTGGRSNSNGIGREMDRDSLRADCIMTAEKYLEMANATGPPETVRAPIMNIRGLADNESELEDLDDPSGDSTDEETHWDVDDNNRGPPGTSFTINGLEPGSNDVTPRELLHDVIRLYQADLLARLNTALERKEYNPSNESLQTQPARTNILRGLPRDINQRSGSDGSTYLIRAVKKGRERDVEELIGKEGADVNYTDEEGRTPLLHAVMEGDGRMVDILTGYGAKLNATHNGRTILQEAIEGDSASIVLQLRKLGAKLDEPTLNGMRPLLYIIQRNPRVSTEVLKAFCCRGEDDAALPQPEMNVVDEKGLTAVHHAVLCDNEEAIEILLSNGADPNIGCKEGKTPLHSAVTKRNEIALKKLLQHCNDANESFRVNVDAEDNFHRTPLVVSVREGGYKFAKQLLEAGADVKKCIPLIPDLNGLSPPMRKIIEQYRTTSPSPSNTDSASIASSPSSIFTTNSTRSTTATVRTSSLSSRSSVLFSVLRLRRRDTQ
jgi:ankyrin repeat protein